MTNINIDPQSLCPCCSKQTYQQCCQPFHLKKQSAKTPEQLMRSRFCAFYLKDYDYLIATHHSQYLNGLDKETLAQEPLPQWLSLDVIRSSHTNDKGQVTFQAWYKLDDEIDAIHECSDFLKCDGQWLYTEGKQMDPVMPKRNDKCVCYSGKKFKQCCGR